MSVTEQQSDAGGAQVIRALESIIFQHPWSSCFCNYENKEMVLQGTWGTGSSLLHRAVEKEEDDWSAHGETTGK